MKDLLVKCIVISVITLLIIGVAAKLIFDATPDKHDELPETTEKVFEYMLGDYNGKIALYEKGYSMPVEIFDVNTSSLPQSDKELIEKGIGADNDEEAQKLIEDYTS